MIGAILLLIFLRPRLTIFSIIIYKIIIKIFGIFKNFENRRSKMRIVVKNLPQSTREDEIKEFFGNKGSITDVFLLKNSQGVFRRMAFVGFKTKEEADNSVTYFNNTYFQNHKIIVEVAREEEKSIPKNDSQLRKALYSKKIVIKNIKGLSENDINEEARKFGKLTDIKMEDDIAIITFKEGEKAEKAFKSIKLIAGKRVRLGNYKENIKDAKRDHFNSLFFNFETVVKRVCENENISKNKLIDLDDKHLGTRMAVLETDLVNQTKIFLANNNIYINGIQNDRSKNILILRNPDLLGVIDMIKGEFRVKIAPSKCLALLEFKDEKEAENCFKEINMKRFKKDVIYCEFAPICTRPEISEEIPIKNKKLTNKIIVKNVPFQATQDELKRLFSSYVHIKDVRLPVKADGKHRGFGFIVLDNSENVDKAIEYFGSSTHLYGRRLVLERAKL